jgi:hypothetical protein
VSLGADLGGWIIVDGGADSAQLLRSPRGLTAAAAAAAAAAAGGAAAAEHGDEQETEASLWERLAAEGSELVCCEVYATPSDLARGWAAALASGTLWPQMTTDEIEKKGFALLRLIEAVDAGTTLAVLELRDASRARTTRVGHIVDALKAATDASDCHADASMSGLPRQAGEPEPEPEDAPEEQEPESEEEEPTPPLLLHNPTQRQALWRSCWRSLRMPLPAIRAYFGAEVGNYFEAVELLIKMLGVASVGGTALWATRRWLAPTAHGGSTDALLTELYRTFMNAWAVTVAWGWERWEREQGKGDVEQHWDDISLSLRVSGHQRLSSVAATVAAAAATTSDDEDKGEDKDGADAPQAKATAADRSGQWQRLKAVTLSWTATAGMLSLAFAVWKRLLCHFDVRTEN